MVLVNMTKSQLMDVQTLKLIIMMSTATEDDGSLRLMIIKS